MEDTKPSDFDPLKTWFIDRGHPVFGSDKVMYYHIKPIQKELIEAGAMAKVGNHLFLHKTRFWPEYQRILLSSMSGGRQ